MENELDFGRWEAAIGKLILSLSRVEGELLLKYESHLSRTKYFNSTFAQRLNKVEELYNSECGKNENATAIFEDIRTIAKYRNLVAHNPIFADHSGDSFGFTIAAAKNKSIKLDIAELERKSNDIWNICIEFACLVRLWPKNGR